MPSNDLAVLYSAKKTIENYYAVERPNEKLSKSADKECAAVTADEKAKIAMLDEKIEKSKKSSFFTRRGIIILVAGILLLALVLIGSRSFLEPVVSPDISIITERYEDYIEDGGKAPKDYAKAKTDEAKEKAVTDAILPVIAGNILLVTVVACFIAAIIAGTTKDGTNNTAVILGIGAIILVISLIFIIMLMKHCRDMWGLSSSIGTLGIIFKGLWNTVFGIGKIFTITYSYVLFVICLQGSVYAVALTFLFAREKYKLPSNVAKGINDLKAKKAAISKEANEKRSEILKKWDAKKEYNPYSTAYFNLPKYQQDYRTVTSLIWAIENGYAYDIPGARNYWDRKAHDASVQRQLQQVQATADSALKAAQTPPEVTVNVTVWN